MKEQIVRTNSKKSIDEVYENATPTVKRVLNLISAEPTSNSPRCTFVFEAGIRGLGDVKFSCYCTGSSTSAASE